MSEQTSALATVNTNNALAGLGYSPDSEMKPVKMELTQPINAAEGVTAGRFRDTQSNMQFEKMTIIPLGFRDGRVCFASKDPGAPVICRSNDGVQPVVKEGLQRQDGGNGCKKCPMSQWKKIGGKSIPPQCSDTVSMTFAEQETGFLYWLNNKRTSIPAITALRETLRKVILMAQAKKKFLPLFGISVDMKAIKVEKGGKRWYVPYFDGIRPVEDPSEFETKFHSVHNRPAYDDEAEVEAGADPVSQAVNQEYVDA